MDDEGFIFTVGSDLDAKDAVIDENMRNRIAQETFFLAPDRLYIVFDPSATNKVTVRAYDTLDGSEVGAAHVLQQGILSLLESDYDYLMQLGHEATLERMQEEKSKGDNTKFTIDELYENVIRVKFSEDN